MLELKEIKKPVPGNNELLIKVYATTVNRTDCAILLGKPFAMRFFTGLFKPRSLSTGTDFAGKVEAVGKNVSGFKPGNRVWGFNDKGSASHAEYIILSKNDPVSQIPDHITYEQAAASPEGAHYAYNFINKLKLKPGDRVMLNGAGGAIGSAALQLLKHFGAKVTAVCNTKNISLAKSLGADKVIDFEKEDFTKESDQYHYVFDTVGKSSFSKCKPLLLPKGVYLSSELGPGAENIYLPLITRLSGKKKTIFPVPVNIKRTLALLKNLLETNQFDPVIDRSYSIEKIIDAYKYVASGQKTGNVVLIINKES